MWGLAASPEVVAASAVAGYICSPPEHKLLLQKTGVMKPSGTSKTNPKVADTDDTAGIDYI